MPSDMRQSKAIGQIEKKHILSAYFVRASVYVYLKHFKIILSFFRCLESSPLPPVRPPKNPSLLRNHMFALSIVIFRSKSPLWTRGFWHWFLAKFGSSALYLERREICIILFIEKDLYILIHYTRVMICAMSFQTIYTNIVTTHSKWSILKRGRGVAGPKGTDNL